MIAVAAAALLVLAITNVAIGRSLLYPSSVLATAWTASLFWLLLVGSRFFPLCPTTLGIFLVGAASLSVGGLLVSLFRGRSQGFRETRVRSERAVSRLLDVGFWICVLALPNRVMRLKALAGPEAGGDLLSPVFWVSVRRASLAEADQNRLSDNIILLAGFLALAALADDVSRKRLRVRTAGLIALAIAYNVMMAGRASAIVLIAGMVAAAWMASGRVPWKAAALSLVAAALVFSLAAVLQHKGGSVTASAAENVAGTWKSFELYGLGGIVAFDHTVRNPNDIPPVWSVTRSFTQMANKLGGHFELPSLHAGWSRVSNGEWMNVYTMYFAYFPRFGWAGVVAFPFILGVALTWCFRSAQAGDPRARLVYAAAVAGLVLSAFNEEFFMNLSFLLKATAFSWVLYGLPLSPRAFSRSRAVVGEAS
ncbi:MAG: O-antigen polymerase [Thermoanaerobaculia bacterium]